MPISRFNSIPRFPLPYTPADFLAGLNATCCGGVPAKDFGVVAGAGKFWTRSGRQALRLLLEALQLPHESGVAVPLFTDPSLFEAIVSAGHRPVFIDVEPRYLTMDPQCLQQNRSRYSAVIAVHLFGHLANMPDIMSAAGNVPVIEDAAHAPFSYLHQKIAGSFGIAAFYSFASTKYWPAGGGGLALVNDRTLTPRMANLVRSLSPPSRMDELRSLLLQSAKAAIFHRRMYGLFGRPIRRWAEKWKLLEPELDLVAIQRSWSAVAVRQAIRMRQRVELQRANSFYLLKLLDYIEDVAIPRERPGAQYNYHMFPVLLRSGEERAGVMSSMWKKSIDTSMIYSNSITEAQRFGYLGGCPVAESISERLITLPNYARLTCKDLDTIADVFLSSVRAYRRSAKLLAQPPELSPIVRA